MLEEEATKEKQRVEEEDRKREEKYQDVEYGSEEYFKSLMQDFDAKLQKSSDLRVKALSAAKEKPYFKESRNSTGEKEKYRFAMKSPDSLFQHYFDSTSICG